MQFRHVTQRLCSNQSSEHNKSPSIAHVTDDSEKIADVKERQWSLPSSEDTQTVANGGLRFQVSNRRRKRKRPSRSTTVLSVLPDVVQRLYRFSSPTRSPSRSDISYNNPRKVTPLSFRQRAARAEDSKFVPLPEPDSLYTIVVRYLEWQNSRELEKADFELSRLENNLLRQKGFTLLSVKKWATGLSVSESTIAAKSLGTTNDRAPTFVLLLFLRRKYISIVALGIILKHVQARVKTEQLSWETLQIISTRLLRHARIIWPAAMPWIAEFFCTNMRRIIDARNSPDKMHSRVSSDITSFINIMLLLLSIPTASHPVYAALHQEKAQFQILHFMANTTPPIIVTRLGFRAITRNQLAHAKTIQERDWAKLKGPSWPPWKESRTAMDEDKGYDFGASRASKIMQRMYEAGYGETNWERLAETYAGWDTDLSPTIQTRTSLPQIPARSQGKTFLGLLQWAARVRTTRTRREAWACFLAYEASGAPHSEVVYLAMFEKLWYPESKQPVEVQTQSYLADVLGLAETPLAITDDLLPGDMKEVVPESTSPLHQVYLSEPLPSVEGLYHRLQSRHIKPSGRLLALLMEASSNIPDFVNLLDGVKDKYNGGLSRLLYGQRLDHDLARKVPDYLMAAFLRTICRFGRFFETPSEHPVFISPRSHLSSFGRNQQYLLHYAHALLLYHKPYYLPTWTVYIDKVVSSMATTPKRMHLPLFRIVCRLIETMKNIELDIDDETFRLVCIATLTAAHAAHKSDVISTEDKQLVLEEGSARLRRLFYSLTGAKDSDNSNDPLPIPTRTLAPADLHAYVRALGALGDYEGLYSFSSWLTRHHEQVSVHAQARKSSMKLLRSTLVAVRAALEGRLIAGGNGPMAHADEDLVQLVKDQIEKRDDWGGWPSQEAVDAYVNYRRAT